jgi:uncharacterized membrane protein
MYKYTFVHFPIDNEQSLLTVPKMSSYVDCDSCNNTLIKPDPDVSGVGVRASHIASRPDVNQLQVMIAFNISSVLTLLSSIIATQLHGDLPIFLLPKLFYRTNATRQLWIRVLDRLTLGFSDQQLVTGMAVLIIGLGKISQISTYHFYVIESLAMFSCGCHMASVVTLRRYFQEHPVLALIRVGAMLVFAIMLSISIIYAGTVVQMAFGASPQCPLRCTIESQAFSRRIPRILDIIFTVILIWAYYAALVYVFPNGTIFFQTWLVTKPMVLLERLLQAIPGGQYGYQFHERFRHWNAPITAIDITFFLQWVWSILAFGFATAIRVKGGTYLSGSENQWSFGQILAVFLIILPFLSAAEVFIGNVLSYMDLQTPLIKLLH